MKQLIFMTIKELFCNLQGMETYIKIAKHREVQSLDYASFVSHIKPQGQIIKISFCLLISI